MALNLDNLYSTIQTAATGAFGDSWGAVKHYALPEFKKIAATFVDIENGIVDGYYNQDAAKILFQMQVKATEAVLVATTQLILIAVQKAMNAILSALKDVVNGALGFALI